MTIGEQVIEKVVFRHCLQCAENMGAGASSGPQEFSGPISTAGAEEPVMTSHFPTMAEVERAMILAAYQRSNCRPLLAARLLGIGKTTMYRKLREIKQVA